MGYVPPYPPPRLNVDRRGMPLDYPTYIWLLYGKRVADVSPSRIGFLHGQVNRPPWKQPPSVIPKERR